MYAAKSFVIALALVKKQVTADQASDAAQVEVRSQIEQWGEVEDCQLPLSFFSLLTVTQLTTWTTKTSEELWVALLALWHSYRRCMDVYHSAE